MPSPNKGESKDAFLGRCMGSEEAQSTFPHADQRYAFCSAQWKKRHEMTEEFPLPVVAPKEG